MMKEESQGCLCLSRIFEHKMADFQIFMCITVRWHHRIITYVQLLIGRLCFGVGTICPQYSVTISIGSVIINTAILLFSLL